MARTQPTKESSRCRHNWDYCTIIWTDEGRRVHPCKNCSELLQIGTVKIRPVIT